MRSLYGQLVEDTNHEIDEFIKDRDKKGFLPVEVQVDGSLANMRLPGDLGDGGMMKPFLREDAEGRVEDSLSFDLCNLGNYLPPPKKLTGQSDD